MTNTILQTRLRKSLRSAVEDWTIPPYKIDIVIKFHNTFNNVLWNKMEAVRSFKVDWSLFFEFNIYLLYFKYTVSVIVKSASF